VPATQRRPRLTGTATMRPRMLPRRAAITPRAQTGIAPARSGDRTRCGRS
jgi:hypothetical protein